MTQIWWKKYATWAAPMYRKYIHCLRSISTVVILVYGIKTNVMHVLQEVYWIVEIHSNIVCSVYLLSLSNIHVIWHPASIELLDWNISILREFFLQSWEWGSNRLVYWQFTAIFKRWKLIYAMDDKDVELRLFHFQFRTHAHHSSYFFYFTIGYHTQNYVSNSNDFFAWNILKFNPEIRFQRKNLFLSKARHRFRPNVYLHWFEVAYQKVHLPWLKDSC